MNIERFTFAQIRPLASSASRDGVVLKETKGETQWYGMRSSEEACPFIVAGLYIIQPGHARIRGVWCDPVMRGAGHGERLMDFLTQRARDLGCSYMSQLAAYPVWWINKRGWTPTKQMGDGHAWISKVI